MKQENLTSSEDVSKDRSQSSNSTILLKEATRSQSTQAAMDELFRLHQRKTLMPSNADGWLRYDPGDAEAHASCCKPMIDALYAVDSSAPAKVVFNIIEGKRQRKPSVPRMNLVMK